MFLNKGSLSLNRLLGKSGLLRSLIPNIFYFMRCFFFLMLVLSTSLYAKTRLPRVVKPERIYQIESVDTWKDIRMPAEKLQLVFKQFDCCHFDFQLVRLKEHQVLISGDLIFESSARDRQWGPSSSRGKLFHVKNAFSPMKTGAFFLETRYIEGREQFIAVLVDWDHVDRQYTFKGFVKE